jgi:hypothetical protein
MKHSGSFLFEIAGVGIILPGKGRRFGFTAKAFKAHEPNIKEAINNV